MWKLPNSELIRETTMCFNYNKELILCDETAINKVRYNERTLSLNYAQRLILINTKSSKKSTYAMIIYHWRRSNKLCRLFLITNFWDW